MYNSDEKTRVIKKKHGKFNNKKISRLELLEREETIKSYIKTNLFHVDNRASFRREKKTNICLRAEMIENRRERRERDVNLHSDYMTIGRKLAVALISDETASGPMNNVKRRRTLAHPVYAGCTHIYASIYAQYTYVTV